jgi:uncharacterized UPF0146 family protein
MEPREKAKQIVNKIQDDLFKNNSTTIYTEDAVICALILVNEIMNAISPFGSFLGKDWWTEVKEELENY